MNSTLSEKVALEKSQHELVKGEYTPMDARDILLHLIDKKINFHKARIFSQDIRFGKHDSASDKRIVELKQSKDAVLELISKAEKSGKMVRINANIVIDLV